MRLSTRARYGVRLMLALARNYGKGPMYLRDIARMEEISQKYLSLLMITLKEVGLVHSNRGAYGGYSLARAPSQINFGEIVDVLEGCCLVDCVRNPSTCPRASVCTSRDVWAFLEGKISETLRSVTLEQRLIELDNKLC
ncbi:MAG: Rrf2 family transcriptional regulator [Syntrophales bacterium]